MLVKKIMGTKSNKRATSLPPAAFGRNGRSLGFSLVELMVTLAIAAILLAVGVPSFRDFVLNQRVKTASSQIFYALTLARSEAIKRNAEVRVQKVNTGWQDGWTVATVTGAVTLGTQDAFANLAIAGSANSVTYGGSGRLTGG
ncbi:GspH/FimT family pseudopilin [Noviherbaspirillum sedimenti]|nr:GspH/FimT family pseudopilin [Noviherbaspirillum sedimenti]